MYKKLVRAMLGIGMSGVLLLTACGSNAGNKEDTKDSVKTETESKTQEENKSERTGEEVNTLEVAENIRLKYEESELYEYTDPIIGIGRDENIEKQMGFDIKGGMFENYTELFNVYEDPELTQDVGSYFEWDETTQVLKIKPPKWDIGSVSTTDMDQDVAGNDGVSHTLFEKGENMDWGNLQQYYLVQYVDENTGEALDKPIVTVFTVKHELDQNIRLKVRIDEEGIPQFSWNKVKGATNYYIMTLNYSEENGYSSGSYVVDSTTETYWTPEHPMSFSIFKYSEADRREDYVIEEYGEGTEPILYDSDYETTYCVIAVSDEGTSTISNTFDETDLAPRIPYIEETGLNHEAESTYCVDSVAALPPYKSVTMCDGKLVQRLINYDFEKAQEVTETWGEYEKEDMSDLHSVEVDVVKIPYTIDGTSFSDVAVVETYNPETLQADLDALELRQEGLRNKSGNVETDVNLDVNGTSDTEDGDAGNSADETGAEDAGDVETADDGTGADETGDADAGNVATSGDDSKEKSDTMVKNDYRITANSALSEYLANSMLSGTEVIDISLFPESSDQDFLADAWQEAFYQNPLILGVDDVGMSYDGESLLVTYETDAATMQKKQDEIVAEVKKIVSEIITDDMTDLEKETAINQYLCDSAEYDMAALENAEENDFATVDDEFNDSFTPYGVIVNKVGVCASYAGSFKLLADEAGLECIAVTGYLDGETPHEWNKVKIDGKWQIVDSTNNDNEELFNALFNLPDSAAKNVLVEDEGFVLDSKVDEYAADSSDEEYYRTNQKYYDKNEIANALAEELNATGTSVLRTDYQINDDDFDEIAQEVLGQMEDDSLFGYYWMGVIYLTREEK